MLFRSVIAHAAEDAGIGFEARQLADAGIERIAPAADQVSGDQGKLGAKLEGGIDHAGEFGFTEEGAEVDVAEVQDAQAIEVRRQAGQRDIHLADAEIGALDKGSVAYHGKGRGHEGAAGGIERAAAARVHVGVEDSAQAGKRLVNRQRGGRALPL